LSLLGTKIEKKTQGKTMGKTKINYYIWSSKSNNVNSEAGELPLLRFVTR
jgi:hypothetical protein